MVWATARSLATTCAITFVFFSSAYLDVSVQRVCFSFEMTNLQLAGLPHSEISGSMCICHSPKLIAAYHVFHRLQEPRHPPYALNYFLFNCANSVRSLFILATPASNEWRGFSRVNLLSFLVSFSICQRTCFNEEFNEEFRIECCG